MPITHEHLFSPHRSRQVRERLETAFHVVEKEYGVTRLLDPEGECGLGKPTLSPTQ